MGYLNNKQVLDMKRTVSFMLFNVMLVLLMIMLKEILSHDWLVIASKIVTYEMHWYLGFVSNTPTEGEETEGQLVKADHQVGRVKDAGLRGIRGEHGLVP